MSDDFSQYPLACFKDGIEYNSYNLHTLGVMQGSTYALRYTIDQNQHNGGTSLNFNKSSTTKETAIQWDWDDGNETEEIFHSKLMNNTIKFYCCITTSATTVPNSTDYQLIFTRGVYGFGYYNYNVQCNIQQYLYDDTVYYLWIYPGTEENGALYWGDAEVPPTITVSGTIPTYTITYNLNGGTGSFNTQTKLHGRTIQLWNSTPTREGYIFKGWALSPTSIIIAYPGDNYSRDAGITLYAIWESLNPTFKKQRAYLHNQGKFVPAKAYVNNKGTFIEAQPYIYY